jgi:hypothetical protein
MQLGRFGQSSERCQNRLPFEGQRLLGTRQMAKKASGKRSGGPTRIESVRHKDKRKNIPTEELRDFVTEEVQQPKTVLYPRDPSLDPQLVWKGKDEQDQQDLAVPAVPIYIQEKIHPHATRSLRCLTISTGCLRTLTSASTSTGTTPTGRTG